MPLMLFDGPQARSKRAERSVRPPCAMARLDIPCTTCSVVTPARRQHRCGAGGCLTRLQGRSRPFLKESFPRGARLLVYVQRSGDLASDVDVWAALADASSGRTVGASRRSRPAAVVDPMTTRVGGDCFALYAPKGRSPRPENGRSRSALLARAPLRRIDRKAIAADPRHHRIDHALHGNRRDARIDRVAAGAKHLQRHQRRHRMRRRRSRLRGIDRRAAGKKKLRNGKTPQERARTALKPCEAASSAASISAG